LLDAEATEWTELATPTDFGNDSNGAAGLSDGSYYAAFCTAISNSITIRSAVFADGAWSQGPELAVGSLPSDVRALALHVVPLDAGRALVLLDMRQLSDGSTYETRAYLYDGATLAATANPGTSRKLFTCVGSFAGEAFIIGGDLGATANDPHPLTTSIERYDAGAGTWAAFDDLPNAVREAAAILMPSADGSRFYCLGGTDPNNDAVTDVSAFSCAAVTADMGQSLCGIPAVPHHDVLVFDMRNPCGDGGADALGQWYTWDPTGETPRAACLHQGVHHYLDDAGVVRYESPGVFADDGTEPIAVALDFAPWSLAELEGSERFYRLKALGKWLDATTIRVTAPVYKGNQETPVGTPWTRDVDLTTSTLQDFEFRPQPGRCAALELLFQETGDGLTRGWALRAIRIEVGTDDGMNASNVSQRVT